MKYALKNDLFAEITKTKNKTISWADHDWGRGLRNHNKMLWSYSATTGGKTGYTKAAGRCLVTSAAKEDRKLVAVVLNCSNDWMEVKKILEYGFSDFTKIKAVEKREQIYKIPIENSLEKNLVVVTEGDIEIILPLGQKLKIRKEILIDSNIDLPVNKNQKIGELIIYHDNREVGRTELLAAHDLNFASTLLRYWHKFNVYLENKFS
jgi:D-alanyl-D-alanine carboxypeptidase